jgi:hypothetical protein
MLVISEAISTASKIEYLNLFNHAYFVAITVFPPIAFGLIPHLLVFPKVKDVNSRTKFDKSSISS